jgi:hypothetical protein
MSLTKLEEHDYLLLKYGVVGISNAILRKYRTKYTPRTISDLGSSRGRATYYGGHFHEREIRESGDDRQLESYNVTETF